MTAHSDHQPPSEEEGAGYASPSADLFAAFVLIALALWYTITALGFRSPGDWQTGPGLVPSAAGISLAAMAVVLGISAWRRRGKPQVADDAGDELALDLPRTGAIIAIVVVYVLALQVLSFPVSTVIAGVYFEAGVFEVATVLSLAALMRLFWGGPFWIIATVSVLWTLTLSVVFRSIFFVILPL